MKLLSTSKNYACIAAFVIFILFTTGCSKGKHDVAPKLSVFTFASGFTNPNGITIDEAGNVWMSDQGSGKHDGKIWMITKNGQKYEAIVGLESSLNGTELDGPAHLLFSNGQLYILGAGAKMYKANVSSFKPGDAPLSGSTLAVEDIGKVVLNYPFVKNTHQSHPYGITKAPDGTFYITDAAANAVLHRSKTGVYTVVAEVPGIANPLPMGPPMVESVPTGVIFLNGKLYVSNLLGFPFPAGKAIIYEITTSGQVSIYQQGFTSLVDIIPAVSNKMLVLEHGTFGPMGFTKNTGQLLWADGQTITPFLSDLNLPVGIVQANNHTWYISSLGDKSILKITY